MTMIGLELRVSCFIQCRPYLNARVAALKRPAPTRFSRLGILRVGLNWEPCEGSTITMLFLKRACRKHI